MVDLVIREKFLTEKAKKGLLYLRKSKFNVIDVINTLLENFATTHYSMREI